MAVSLGAPLWADGSTYNGLALRQFWCATKLFDQGTASAVSCPGGVYPGGGQLAVTAGSGLTVNVAAGYCAVPHPTAGDGAYIFGLMTSGTLTVTASATGYVVANVQDLADSGSYCQVEYSATVPAASIALAEVVSGASAITTVTDMRAYVAPPGCVFPVASGSAAPAVAGTTFMYDVATGALVTGTGTSGSVAPAGFIQVAGTSYVNTSDGQTGLNPGSPSSLPYGMGYGQENPYYLYEFGSTDGQLTPKMQVTFTADGTSDYEVYYKWQLSIPVAAWLDSGGDALTGASIEWALLMDGVQVDATFLTLGNDPVFSQGGGSASWFTSAARGTTLSAGAHTATLGLYTFSTTTGGISGAFAGDIRTSGSGSAFGAGSGYTSALTAENCILRVMAVPKA